MSKSNPSFYQIRNGKFQKCKYHIQVCMVMNELKSFIRLHHQKILFRDTCDVNILWTGTNTDIRIKWEHCVMSIS